jgi:uncharacterized surface protein with fasciclin (FAS1) repeats
MKLTHFALLVVAVACLGGCGSLTDWWYGDIVDVAKEKEQFSMLAKAIDQADLDESLKAEGPYTVFAPTDRAFHDLPEDTLNDLMDPANRDKLQKVLKYHVVQGKMMADDLYAGRLQTLQGETLEVTIEGGTVKINGSTVVNPNVSASNGVIHGIDKVLQP